MLVTMHDMGEIRKTEFLSQRRGCTAIKAETQPYVIGANLKLWQSLQGSSELYLRGLAFKSS